MGITDTENIFFIFARNTPKNKHKIMILPFVSPVLLPLLLLSPGWLLLILSSKERLNHKEWEPETTIPTQDFSQGTNHLMLVSLELLQVLLGQYITNQLLNPCRNRNRNNNRGQTNNRIFGGNTGNFLLGA